jgi:Holliday junction resolvasome RuvABC ATP-dependent DNA helicase subunit
MIGQEKIINELNFIIDSINTTDKNYSVLIRGRSGHGKSHLMNYAYWKIKVPKIYFPIYAFIEKFTDVRVQFLDEVHTMKKLELLYPLIDSGKYSFFMSTNLSGTLPEPLKNRSISLYLSPYTEDDIRRIIQSISSLPPFFAEVIANRSRNSPRVAKILLKRLEPFLGEINNKEDLEMVLDYLGIYEEGFTENDIRYLEYLEKVGTSSLTNLVGTLGIDEQEIKEEIEPFLLEKGLIKISSKGRMIGG